MREIKFRAWDKRNTIMRTWEYMGTLDYHQPFSLFTDSNYDWQQYTGLKDKNGKEIYEGDIVSDPNRTDTPHAKMPAHKYWVVEYKAPKFVMSGWNGSVAVSPELREYGLEIIGNVYENPNLTEVEGEEQSK